MKTFIRLALLASVALCARAQNSMGQIAQPGAAQVTTVDPTTKACVASKNPPLLLYNNAGTQVPYTCGPSGFYIEAPGGSTSTLTASGIGASGAAGANTVTGPVNSIPIINSSGTAVDGARAVSVVNGKSVLSDIPSVKDQPYGALGDTVLSTFRCTAVASSTTLTCSSGAFLSTDVGKSIMIELAGSSTQNFITTIAGFVSATQITLAAAPTNSTPTGLIVYGHDDTAAFQAIAGANVSFIVPQGGYWINGQVHLNKVMMRGQGASTILFAVSPTANTFWVDFPNGDLNQQTGMSGFTLYGPAVVGGSTWGTSQLIRYGGTNGATGAILNRFTVKYGSTCLYVGDTSFYNRFSEGVANQCVQDLVMPNVSNGESTVFDNVQFQTGGPDQGVTDYSDCLSLGTNSGTVTFEHLSIVNCQIHFTSTASGRYYFSGIHMETDVTTSVQPYLVMDVGNTAQVEYDDGTINVGHSVAAAGPPSWATVGAGLLTVRDTSFGNFESGNPLVAAVSGAGNARIYNTNPSVYAVGFSDYLTTTSGGPSYVEPTGAQLLITAPYNAHQNDGQISCNGGTAAVTLPLHTFGGEQITVTNLQFVNGADCIVTGNSGNINKASGATATYTVKPSSAATFYWASGAWNVTTGGFLNVPGSGQLGYIGDNGAADTWLSVNNGRGAFGIEYDTASPSMFIAGGNAKGVALCPSSGGVGSSLTLNCTQGASPGGLPFYTIATIASASTIAPANPFVFLTGTTPVATITAPNGCTTSGTDCTVDFLIDPSTGPSSFLTTGNVAVALSPQVNTWQRLTYHPATSKWYPPSSTNLFGTTGSIGGGALLAGACTSGTVAVSGSTTAMAVSASPVTYPGDGNYWLAYVSTAGTVTVKVCGAVAGTPTASAYNVRVIQ